MKLAESVEELCRKVSVLIENARVEVFSHASAKRTLLFWQVGKAVNEGVLNNERADYGKQIVSRLATRLEKKYGRSFEPRTLRRMMQFAEQFIRLRFLQKRSSSKRFAIF